MAGTPLLAAPGWQPSAPIPLRDISLELSDADPQTPAEAGLHAPFLPRRADGTRYRRYSDAMGELAAPLVFENRATYRLTDADLGARIPRLAFTGGRYFDGIDTGEAAAHEYAAARLGWAGLHPAACGPAGLRGRFADPCDLRRRPANLAISTLTLRLDRRAGRASFLLHWRDPAKVGHAGGLYQVIPVGVFQPSGEAPWNRQHDFSLWRCMIREFAEELGGRSEDYASDSAPVDYDSWPFARQLTGALDHGQVRVWCLGLGTDPLTYATDLLTVAVIDSDVFDASVRRGPAAQRRGEHPGRARVRRRRHRPHRHRRAAAGGRGRPAPARLAPPRDARRLAPPRRRQPPSQQRQPPASPAASAASPAASAAGQPRGVSRRPAAPR